MIPNRNQGQTQKQSPNNSSATTGKKSSTKATTKKTDKAEKTPKEKTAPVKKPETRENVMSTTKSIAMTPDFHDGEVLNMRISLVEPNRLQPRKEFDADRIAELAESIKQVGVIQPLLVQKNDDYYEIIAGERRWRAAKIAGLTEVPVIVREYSKQQAVEVSLIENIQREDLNPIEEALAYTRLMDEFELTQEAVSKRVSKSRAAVTNSVRLLRLPASVQEMLINGELTEGHARTLLALDTEERQLDAARKIIKEGLSVRDTEKLVKSITKPKKAKPQPDAVGTLILKDLEDQFASIFGTRVRIVPRGAGKGRIEIEYYSAAELERLTFMIRSASDGEENQGK